mmetsp:Transcript_114115/g.227101  ORF Transcript_114115/g.227101 Transcript_114115/m.227101 type:complete len:83 (+) Transcript_114115:450-698(+)
MPEQNPAPLPTAAQMGIDIPNVKNAGKMPTAPPKKPPATEPTAPPLRPKATAPPAADAAATCSLASGFVFGLHGSWDAVRSS